MRKFIVAHKWAINLTLLTIIALEIVSLTVGDLTTVTIISSLSPLFGMASWLIGTMLDLSR